MTALTSPLNYRPYRTRLHRLHQALKVGSHKDALLITTAPPRKVSRDTEARYRPESDFYYLTGSSAKDLALVVGAGLKRPLLIAPKPDAHRILWEGRSEDPAKLAAALKLDLVVTSDMRKELLEKLRGVSVLYYQNTPASLGWKIAGELIELPSYLRGPFPASFNHCDVLLAPLRLHKDSYELALIKQAAAITNEALHVVHKLIRPGTSERAIAHALLFEFGKRGAQEAFPSIVATGANAATLHYERLSATLRAGDLVLLDIGAQHELYAADITRTLPVSGEFLPWQRDIYDIVLAAQEASIRAVRPKTSLKTLHAVAARVLTEGLKDLGILRGKTSSLLAKQAYRPYFPHGIGHPLGLDVHDSVPLHSAREFTLEQGMVLTIEPGLYFPRRTGKIPPCGIRIEDDVLVTSRGHEGLSYGFPKSSKSPQTTGSATMR